MNTVVYNGHLTKFDLALQSVALRAGLLLADMSTSAGRTGSELFFVHNTSKLKMRQKFLILENWPLDEEQKEMLKIAKDIAQLDKKAKHRTQQMIVAYKKMELAIDSMCEGFVSGFADKMIRSGLAELEYITTDDAFGYYNLGADPEDPDLTNDQVKASELLRLSHNESGKEDDIFFLTSEFFHDDFYAEAELYKTAAGTEGSTDNFYLNHCFTLPNINLLNADELKAVRNQLKIPGALFRAATTEWMRLCFGNAAMQQRTEYFNAKVLPAATMFQKEIAKNEILQHCDRVVNEPVQQLIMLGEVPVQLVWNFYRHFGAITDATWENLQQQELPKCTTWPVMLMKIPGIITKMANPFLQEDGQPVSVKKSIVID